MPVDIKDAKIQCNNNSRQLLTCNIQSFNKNHESIKQLIQSLNNPTFISLVEVWNPKLSMYVHPKIPFTNQSIKIKQKRRRNFHLH